jgi:uncharacterized protein (DUF1501 family)
MLDQDIETEDALRLLSLPPADETPGPNGWTRRKFLQAVGAGAAAGVAIPTFAADMLGFDLPEAWAGPALGATEGVLVTITFFGGVDGLNVVVPVTNSLYYSQRPTLAIAPTSALPLDPTFGLHPTLSYLQQLWQAGQVAIVHGAGNPEADLSHFTSMASWMAGRFGGGPTSTGWVGRWLDGLPGDTGDTSAVAIGTSVSLQLQGANRRGVAVVPNGSMFGSTLEPPDRRMYDGLRAMAAPAGRGPWHDMTSKVLVRQLDLARDVAPVLKPNVTGSELVKELTVAARLINADLGFRIIDIGVGGFDTHDNQAGKLTELLQQFDDGLRAFYATLAPTFRSRVSLLTLSEFGRTSFSNGSAGTDHGTSNVMFVIGANVKGGHYGAPSSLNLRNRWDRMVPTTDYRHVLGTCLDGWMGGGASTVLRGTTTNLGFFRRGPGEAAPPPPPPVVVTPTACEFVPMTPDRLFDTRTGVGGRVGALGPGESWTANVAGRVGIPADAVAVVLNVAATEQTTSSFVTLWPAGKSRPNTANLNIDPGPAVANLTTVALGSNGAICVYNNAGTTHLIADVSGYFRAGSNVGLVPLTPDRLLDTRYFVGGTFGPVGPRAAIDVQVTGRGGVPANATAVVLNVTVTDASEESYITVWPTGKARPTASSGNFGRGDTRGNLVMCPIGAGGKVSIYQENGYASLIADVLGAYVPGQGGSFVALSPGRLLDTREGIGAPIGRVGRTPIELTVLGREGVPATGVRAVVMNLVGVLPNADTFVTAYPSGATRPGTSNLNVPAWTIRPNAVVVGLGANGKVQLYNENGNIDLVADVLGYVTG